MQVVALGLEPAWRREPASRRSADAHGLESAVAASAEEGVRTSVFSCVGLEPGVDLVMLRIAGSLDLLEDAGVRSAASGLGSWLVIRRSLLGRVAP